MNHDPRRAYEAMLESASGKKSAPGEEQAERFYGFVTGVQDRAHNVEFRKGEGVAWPFREYSYLIGGEAVHAGEFRLFFANGEQVTVRGRHLRPLYEKLLRHRVTWIREGDRDERIAGSELFVDEIEGPVKVEEDAP